MKNFSCGEYSSSGFVLHNSTNCLSKLSWVLSNFEAIFAPYEEVTSFRSGFRLCIFCIDNNPLRALFRNLGPIRTTCNGREDLRAARGNRNNFSQVSTLGVARMSFRTTQNMKMSFKFTHFSCIPLDQPVKFFFSKSRHFSLNFIFTYLLLILACDRT